MLLKCRNTGLVDEIRFMFHVGHHLPEGYLFLCPLEDLRAQGSDRFILSPNQTYWSLHASGSPKLTLEEAVNCGFSPPELELQVDVRMWEQGRVYRALRKFHEAKGFDPESQDVARHLGYPLYHISQHGDSSSAQSQ